MEGNKMKYFRNAQVSLIDNYYNIYSTSYATDFAFEDKILAYGDMWLEQLLTAIRKAKRRLPSYLYVEEGGEVLKAYLASTSGYLEHTYVTSTKMYHYLPDKDKEVDNNLRISSLYSDEDLEVLMDSNWIYYERIKDLIYYESLGKAASITRYYNSLVSAKATSDKINKRIKNAK
jgi:hypothetical protein